MPLIPTDGLSYTDWRQAMWQAHDGHVDVSREAFDRAAGLSTPRILTGQEPCIASYEQILKRQRDTLIVAFAERRLFRARARNQVLAADKRFWRMRAEQTADFIRGVVQQVRRQWAELAGHRQKHAEAIARAAMMPAPLRHVAE